jgi:hypothetical protein
MNTTLKIERHTLITSATLSKGMASQLRGALANRSPDEVLLHHHDLDGSMIYLYPRIQYKVINNQAMLIALEEGIDSARQTLSKLHSLNLGGTNVVIEHIDSTQADELFGCSTNFVEYGFLTPWLALNQKNARIYEQCHHEEGRNLLQKILIGNFLSMSKSVQYDVPAKIKANLTLRHVPVSMKGINMLGFIGRFRINFHLPDLIGVGKSVSRGFGTVHRIVSGKEKTSCSS